jgi:hypothetical protein
MVRDMISGVDSELDLAWEEEVAVIFFRNEKKFR